MKRYYIYKLVDPFSDEVKYVGCSVNPTQRSHGHYYRISASRDLAGWVRGLAQQGIMPILRVIEQCDSRATADAVEHFWV
ncbi:MAG: hypothetical protein PHR35_19860, partial [Kiritimatiellae bacterium]|nr:hypothetical protein [Kiritimatiellia bacterium]